MFSDTLQWMSEQAIETRTQAIGRELFRLAREASEHVQSWNRWAHQVLAWCLSDPEVKSRVLRFVDVLPNLATPQQIIRHLNEYFPAAQLRLPALLRAGVTVTRSGLLTSHATAAAIRHLVEQMARQFIIGATIPEALETIARLESLGCGCTLDLLGEEVTSEAEADHYAQRYLELLAALLEAHRARPHNAARAVTGPNVNLSIKPSALTAHFDPLTPNASCELALQRLRPVLELAQREGAFINLDMEHYELRDLTLELAKRLLREPALEGYPHVGIVIQAYLRDAEATLDALLYWLKTHQATVTVRLVKGAYWDAEVVRAAQRQWPAPVFLEKAETDRNFEHLTARLLREHAVVRTAIASHNVRSIAHALAVAETLHVPRERFEIQMLYGMADALKTAVVTLGCPVRVYAPYGELIPGMAYLVRRILENTANESFLRQEYWEGATEDELLKPPAQTGEYPARRPAPSAFVNEPVADVARAEVRAHCDRALTNARQELGTRHPLRINGQAVTTAQWVERRNPARPSELVGMTAQATPAEVESAIAAATAGVPAWRETPVEERAQLLRQAAELMRAQRATLTALEVFEVGKTWREADADVCEAIDHLEYYALQMRELAAGKPLQGVPGETNLYRYRPRGVAVVISPWNFPVAILTGMTSAALVTGNSVIMKPSGCSAHLAAHVAELLLAAGVPGGALQFLPGPGRDIGLRLVRDARTAAVLFTGSRAVGLELLREAAVIQPGQRHQKYVMTELGGKNAIIVDDDADLDEAIPGILASAFGYQGQKCSACSRLIVVEGIHEPLLRRLTEAVDSLRVLPPEDARCDIGPLIDEEAARRIRRAIEEGQREGRLAYIMPAHRMPAEGYFCPPAIITDIDPRSRLAQEELFGPVLVVLRARTFENAIALANDVDYGLTGGVYSRSPSHLTLATQRLDVGNVYLNRKITGAVVSRQPFGGWKLSGIGQKAGGPDYLLPLMLPQTITENTTRHGLALEHHRPSD